MLSFIHKCISVSDCFTIEGLFRLTSCSGQILNFFLLLDNSDQSSTKTTVMGDRLCNNYFGTAVLKSTEKADERCETLSAEKLLTP